MALAAAAFGVYQWRLGVFGLRDPAQLHGDTCAGKDFCVTVYLAPWCPHCQSAVPKVQKMLALTKIGGKNGVRVAVGMGEPSQNEAMARAIAGGGVTVDQDSSLARKWNVSGVPSYQVLDKEGAVVLEGREAYQWVHEKFGG